jgi:hypothetical protein
MSTEKLLNLSIIEMRLHRADEGQTSPVWHVEGSGTSSGRSVKSDAMTLQQRQHCQTSYGTITEKQLVSKTSEHGRSPLAVVARCDRAILTTFAEIPPVFMTS